ncbi:G-type lectin S-receptor-like serine/threonine-protein kinase SD2-5 [Hordeum vulgare]|nr:G-type lectin S-receptor-like serine/threonine-protein kinase SD2-5 [Hordeum vulgare]
MSIVVPMLEGEMAIVSPVNPFHYVSSSGSSSGWTQSSTTGTDTFTGSIGTGTFTRSADTRAFTSSSRDAGRDSEVSAATAPPKPTDAMLKGVKSTDAVTA